MTFMDLVSLISLLLSVVSFATSSVGKLNRYKQQFMAVGYVLFGFVLSRMVYTLLPPGQVVGVQPRVIVWVLLLPVMAIVVLVTLKKEGTNLALFAVASFFWYLAVYGKAVGLIEPFKLRDNEAIAAIDVAERAADFDREIEIIQWMEQDRTKEERKALDERVGILRSRKAERLAHPPSQ